MVDAVGDPYTVYQTPSQREISDTDLRGSFDGIGIQVDMKDNRLTVVAPIEGSPAEAAGFRPGDIVLEVDGKSLSGKTLNDTVGLIRGQRGTPVTLTILRPGTADPFPITVVRAEIKLKSVRVADAGRPGRLPADQLVLGLDRRRDGERGQEPDRSAGAGDRRRPAQQSGRLPLGGGRSDGPVRRPGQRGAVPAERQRRPQDVPDRRRRRRHRRSRSRC